MGSDVLVVGVAGGSGSGKTTIARILVNKLGTENVTLIPHDSYYRDLSHLTFEERSNFNFDHPDSLETELFVQHVKKLRRGESIEVPLYDFATHLRRKETVAVKPTPVILLEGILLLHSEELREQLDIKIFVDTEPDIRFIRRLKRDTKERGRSVDDITSQYLTTVRPMHLAFVEPTKNFADLIIPEGGYDSHVAIDMITSRLQMSVEEQRDCSSNANTNTSSVLENVHDEVKVKQISVDIDIEGNSNNTISTTKAIKCGNVAVSGISSGFRNEMAERLENI
uniref:Uridine kinase n=2 Tax=Sar TaxID=2698737 RepID=A0A7S3LNB9_9STRA|mmetsp:Transcript_20574/g.24945  ORF Transcript_20574/g.24945 Transcript_20574/m.24945 type:complete len:282 (-) Transcript_20574:282-1127(-)|eukprot:CAMPEP_0204843478 /NCGR_PEP_ID=MMETSP1346-20131115/48001_1 /ASSEMBLY_ACC=CAM_ASM_000771 /TAXON_ID=215587 /ORGANISM="Aplanochytrium stocchinoi, Strain GSBS06" /LENGTH=281 /DNA_ID=CAMNT_0051982625 /DNA_START=910 /DNA_END=1755 /DNA_ORIENTATION=+